MDAGGIDEGGYVVQEQGILSAGEGNGAVILDQGKVLVVDGEFRLFGRRGAGCSADEASQCQQCNDPLFGNVGNGMDVHGNPFLYRLIFKVTGIQDAGQDEMFHEAPGKGCLCERDRTVECVK